MATLLAMTILAFIISACSSNSKGFSIEGRLLSMNQADFYVYSPDGAIAGICGRSSADGNVIRKGTYKNDRLQP